MDDVPDLSRPAHEVAPLLLGCRIARAGVRLRLTEVEAYAGPSDPASHAFRGPTARNAVMFGPCGVLYVYFVYGMHWCANVVTGPEGTASAVLMRAGVVEEGEEVARARTPGRAPATRARGPAGVAKVLDLTGAATGERAVLLGRGAPAPVVTAGPRVGVTLAADVPWRYYVADDPSVSAYRAGSTRRRAGRSWA